MRGGPKRNRTDVLLLLLSWCSTSTLTIGLIGDGEMEVGEEEDYTYRYTVTTRMTPALRWAAMRTSLMFHNVRDKVTRQCVSTYHNLFEEKGESKRIRTELLQLASLTA